MSLENFLICRDGHTEIGFDLEKVSSRLEVREVALPIYTGVHRTTKTRRVTKTDVVPDLKLTLGRSVPKRP